jgi:cyclophilin family peptidyl-prolyl cis-trans isomerase
MTIRPTLVFAARACTALWLLLAGAAFAQTMVRLHTVLGPIDVELFDSGAPATVANFLGYVRSGAYDNTFIHRSMPNFVIQGGGYGWNGGPVKVPAGPAVVNEFGADRSNVRGTIAMAKLPNQPDSATTEWFFNTANNAANLDRQNGGFTVFGRATAPSMATVDAIAALPIVNAGGSFANLPLRRSVPPGSLITFDDLVVVSRVAELPARATLSDADRIFDWLEAAFPQYAAPASAPSASAEGYYFRHYQDSDAYLGVKDGNVYYLVPAIDQGIHLLATVPELLGMALAAGY